MKWIESKKKKEKQNQQIIWDLVHDLSATKHVFIEIAHA